MKLIKLDSLRNQMQFERYHGYMRAVCYLDLIRFDLATEKNSVSINYKDKLPFEERFEKYKEDAERLLLEQLHELEEEEKHD